MSIQFAPAGTTTFEPEFSTSTRHAGEILRHMGATESAIEGEMPPAAFLNGLRQAWMVDRSPGARLTLLQLADVAYEAGCRGVWVAWM